MEQEFTEFKKYYLKGLVSALEAISAEKITQAVKIIRGSILAKKNTIYIFGNGGSHAIARHLGVSLSDELANVNQSIRINYGIDFHTSQVYSSQGKYENVFVQTLKTEAADSEDLVILISGSGDSNNILQTADYCISNNIPAVSFSGFDGGKLAKKKITVNIVAAINDQQICEDVTQLLFHIIAKAISLEFQKSDYKIDNLVKEYKNKISKSLEIVTGKFLLELSDTITEAFINNQTIFVLGPEGHGLSISAEHIAHNLNWDAVYRIKTPPRRNIVSSPTSADLSGVGNDRLMAGVVTVQQLDKAEENDVVILFIHDIDNPGVQASIQKAIAHDTKIFAITADKINPDFNINYCSISSDDKFLTADVTQMLGHITARLVRFRLKTILKEIEKKMPTLDFLINEDMAQRRLLNNPNLY